MPNMISLTANLKDGWTSRMIDVNLPLFSHPLLPSSYVDPKWARPYVFHDFTSYIYSEPGDVQNDFNRLVSIVNGITSTSTIDRYKKGLLAQVDEHISRSGRLLFPDLLMYVDCLAYLCYASDLMTEEQIIRNYASWVKYIVDNRKSYIKSSTRWGIGEFVGSQNESDLNSCF